MRYKLLAFLVCGLLFLSLACSAGGALSNSASQSKSGDVLYQDDFSDPQSGWNTYSDDVSEVNYQDGGLRILVNQAQYDYWSIPREKFDDTRVEVEAVRLSGPEDNDFGIVCRYQDKSNFYALLISSDGYAGILQVLDGNYNLISGERMDYFEDIQKSSEVKKLRAECVGDTLALSVNGSELLRVQDSAFSSGQVGLIVGTYDEPGVEMFFDNFVVYRP